MFTNNWFEITGIKNFEKYVLKYVSPLDKKHNFLEIGCYEGQASCWLMENTDAKLVVIDTFKGSQEHDTQFEKTLLARFTDNIQEYKDRITIKQGTSRDVLKLYPLTINSFDFIYVDGSHQASDVLEDAVLAFPLLKEGGIMIFDDYTWGAGMSLYDTPKFGIDAFLKVYFNQIEVLETNSQVIIRKK